MIDVIDRVPKYPGRVKITRADGSVEFVTIERADEPTVVGTPLNRALFESMRDSLLAIEGNNKVVKNGSSNYVFLYNNAVNSSGVRNISAGTAELEAGVSKLATGQIYVQYE